MPTIPRHWLRSGSNGAGASPACVSAFSRCSAWRCTIGFTAVYLRCSPAGDLSPRLGRALARIEDNAEQPQQGGWRGRSYAEFDMGRDCVISGERRPITGLVPKANLGRFRPCRRLDKCSALILPQANHLRLS